MLSIVLATKVSLLNNGMTTEKNGIIASGLSKSSIFARMEDRRLHIISFDNPYPPVYGGVLDVFFKVRALHKIGFEIYLHCFVDSDRGADDELKKLVKEVHFYRRNKRKSALKLLSPYPFAVHSRYSKDLVANLEKVKAPILFEGQHTTFVTTLHEFPNRKMVLRLHNLEANYYLGQSRSETNHIKKTAYFSEYLKYTFFQKDIAKFDAVLALSRFEFESAKQYNKNMFYIPVFHGNETVANLSEFGKYAFYHGDLRLADNRRAARFLIKAFKKIPDYNLLIASGNDGGLTSLIADVPNVSFVSFENHDELAKLLEDAHINVMLSFQESGTKLKLVNALYNSRFCVINKNMIDDHSVRELCTMAETEQDFVNAVNDLKDKPYADTSRRQKVLDAVLNDVENARKIEAVFCR
ncbi:MAG: glycosyltransferase [Flavobacterium sp.]|nr:MAG: glycosyltransferase [Flavobacterium sp.]